jgi:hypothetical protein
LDPRRILIVANQTAGGPHLQHVVRERMQAGACRFRLLVPATAPRDHVWTEGQVVALAERRKDEAVSGLRELGADIDGVVGDASPVEAIGDTLLEESFDEIILSTLPPGASRWLRQDLPHRIERRFGRTVTLVVADQMPAGI